MLGNAYPIVSHRERPKLVSRDGEWVCHELLHMRAFCTFGSHHVVVCFSGGLVEDVISARGRVAC